MRRPRYLSFRRLWRRTFRRMRGPSLGLERSAPQSVPIAGAKIGPFRAKVRRARANSGRSSPAHWAEFGPSLVDIAPELVDSGPKLVNPRRGRAKLVDPGPSWVETGRNSVEFGPKLVDSGLHRPSWVGVSKIRPTSATFGRLQSSSSAEIVPDSTKLGRIRPDLARCGQRSARVPRSCAALIPEHELSNVGYRRALTRSLGGGLDK